MQAAPLPLTAHKTGSTTTESLGGRIPELSEDVRMLLPALDEGALGVFFDHYFERIHSYLRRLVREEHLAEDLTQDVFLHVYRSLPKYDPARPLSPWVFTIAMNKVRDYWRSRSNHEQRRAQSVDDEEAREIEAKGERPGGSLEASERSEEVARAIEDLPPMLRETFVLRYYEEFSFEEIGKLVNRNETAIRKRYSRALGELREGLSHLSVP